MSLCAIDRREWSARSVPLMVARLLATGLVGTMGWIHLQLWLDGYREMPVVGTLFLLNAIGAVALATALLVAPAHLLGATAMVTALFTAGTLAGLILSLTVGLFRRARVSADPARARHADRRVNRSARARDHRDTRAVNSHDR